MSTPDLKSEAGSSGTTPGLIQAVASCLCGFLGFFIPIVGVVLAIIGIVMGRQAYKIGKANSNDTVHITGMIGGLISLGALVVALFALAAAMLWGAGMMAIGSGSLL